MTAYAECAICYCPSICLKSHGWISRKRLNLGSCNFHHTVALSLCFLRDKFHPEILRGSPWARVSKKGGLGKTCFFRSLNAFARWQHKLELLSLLQGPNSNLFARCRHYRALTVASAALSCSNMFMLRCRMLCLDTMIHLQHSLN